MAKGRPRKPIELEKLQGRPGRRPLKEVKKTEVVTSQYPAPDYLPPEGKKEWKKIITAYEKIGMVTETDLEILAIWCDVWVKWLDNEKEYKKEKNKKEYDGKLQRMRLLHITAKDLRKDLMALSCKLGFSPVDRMKLAMPTDKDQKENDVLNFLNKKKGA